MIIFVRSLFHFRNAEHLHWFIGTVVVFLAHIPYWTYCVFKKTSIGYPIAINVHASTSLIAALAILVLHLDTQAYSVDCIWFNALMAFIYFTVYKAFQKRHYIAYKPTP